VNGRPAGATHALTIPRRRADDGVPGHEALFAAGLEQLRQMAHATWTDHNVHDPGITILELLAYALTDLGYRADFPLQDLLARETDTDGAMAEHFVSAREILPGRPLTQLDYRKLLIDLEGVKNAWVRPAAERLYADTVRGRLLREAPAGEPGIVPVDLGGLYEVSIDFMDELTQPARREAVLQRARERLQANRNLCEDFVRVAAVPAQAFVLCGELELAPGADLARVHAEVLFAVQEYLAPPVRRYSLEEMGRRAGPDGTPYTADSIFRGPALRFGFIDDAELERAELRSEIRLSDVIGIVMDVPGVRAVRELLVSPAGAGALPDRWVVPVREGRKAQLDRGGSRLVLHKRGLPFVARATEVELHWARMAEEAAARVETERVDDFPIPAGRFRRPAAYHSVQNHFPAVYGLGEAGLVGAPSERRRALALQLKGYLLHFDQVMADLCAQLGRVADLFSTDPALERTYFHQRVDSFAEHERLYAPAAAEALESGIEPREVHVERRNRFLDHLIARFGEQFHEFAEIMRSEFAAPAASMIRPKCEFLRDYPAISAGRGLAYDASLRGDADLWNSDNVSGLERRLARLLGIRRADRRDLAELSYDIYAEIDDTPGDEFRFRVRHSTTRKILLSSSTRYLTPALAREEMRLAIAWASHPDGYQRRRTVDGRHYFNIIDETGEVIARRIEYFVAEATMEAAIQSTMEYLRSRYGEEGMYVIESILLRPTEAADPLLPICAEPDCDDCAERDPYSYRVHVVLPAYADRFEDMQFRRWAEQVIREETPAHVLPRVCWISRDEMVEFERVYRDWIYLSAGREPAARRQKLNDFVRSLFRVRSAYPAQQLRDCGPGEVQERFVLGRTALGTLE
jgi:uncharacterized protein